MSDEAEFGKEVKNNIRELGNDRALRDLSRAWTRETVARKYSYNFTWMGRPVIQYPQDLIALQEIIWRVKPDVIVETGIARGGSIVFYASMLELIGGNGKVLGIDTDIREHNRAEIEKHPLSGRITMIQGSSVSEDVRKQVYAFCEKGKKVLLVLDSDHTHTHVLKELELYSPLVTKGSYLVVFDTVIEDLPDDFYPDRPWGKGDNPRTAVREFLKNSGRFEVDREITDKLLVTMAPEGYLKCVRD